MPPLKNILFFSICFLLITSCKKSDNPSDNPILIKYFEDNILNRNFTVSLATDNTVNLTSDYEGYIFVLLKTDDYHGPLKATKGTDVYTGTWSTNNDFSKLIITLPDPPAEFGFLNRDWRFTSKSLPTMELAPWGSSDPLVLHMYRQ